MHHARRRVAIVISCATWFVAAGSVAHAKGVPDPHPILTSPPETPLWQFLAFVALVVLLAVAIVGLGYSLSHSRRSEPSPRSHPPMRA
jgi:hypothetical protein